MTTNPITARAVAGSGHRSKKTEAFNALQPVIIDALNSGASIRSLYRELKKDGHDVGSLTWFRKLVERIDLKAGSKKDQPSAAAVTVAASTLGHEAARAFGDARFKSDY